MHAVVDGYESGMNKLLYSLTESEFLLIRETELPAIADLDEDALSRVSKQLSVAAPCSTAKHQPR
jgi:hypothetical protein